MTDTSDPNKVELPTYILGFKLVDIMGVLILNSIN